MDTVKDGVTGFHFGKMDPDALVDKDAEAVSDEIDRPDCLNKPVLPLLGIDCHRICLLSCCDAVMAALTKVLQQCWFPLL